MADVKRTYVDESEVMAQMERPGFMHVVLYGSMRPEPNEIGSIARQIGEPKLHPTGFWEVPIECIERIFVGSPPADG